MVQTFKGCTSLQTIEGFTTLDNVDNFSATFAIISNLQDILSINNIKKSIDFRDCPLLTHDTLMRIINALMTESGKFLYLGNTNLAKLTAEEIAIATDKGWTVN
jgi:hypothetical protein